MNHENTRIYQQALALVSLSHQVVAQLPTGYAFLADQLKRASASVALNFAEGYHQGSRKEQQRYTRIARGSAQECAAILDVAHRFHAITAAHHTDGKELCDHLVRMLHRFHRSLA